MTLSSGRPRRPWQATGDPFQHQVAESVRLARLLDAPPSREPEAHPRGGQTGLLSYEHEHVTVRKASRSKQAAAWRARTSA